MSRLKQPLEHDDFLNYQLKRLVTLGGAPAIRLCEGRYGVARMEWRLVAALAEDGPMPLTALVKRTDIDQARVSRAVASLVAKGLVRRQRRPEGGRAVIGMTEAGHGLYRDLFPALSAINQRIMAVLDEAEAQTLEEFLQRLTAQARAILQSGGGVEARTNRRLGGSRRLWPHSPAGASE
jgi:DNA-binding MarR family transcriptional regulator